MTITLSPSPTNGYDALDVFFIAGDTSTTPRFVVRDATYTYDDQQPRITRWADSSRCPVVLARLRAISDIQVRFSPPYPLDRPRTRGLPMPPSPPPADGDYVSVAAEGVAVGAPGRGRVTVFSNVGPWVEWGFGTQRALNPCWSASPPADLSAR